ncbi:uncharacterized protein HaLaN_06698 [Haematococcus lacustris]|uniref:Transmembrane protein 186 n=1 Tax=Haematococcus lacustris TaxID=44745 RepID=A0A699YXG7_HAELA|nr:uncharacterized protein HaLaN_06698 [Haematococcus lacustris]
MLTKAAGHEAVPHRFYSSRYVGELSLLLPERRVARFSVLDMYGNRLDKDVPVADILPPFKGRSVAEVRRLAGATLMPLEVQPQGSAAGPPVQFYLSIRHGYLVQKE